MKAVRMVLILAVVLTTAMSVSAQKKGEKTVVFNANLHCESCKAKIEKNIPYEKGVKDLKVDMKTQTIKVTFREDKNSVEGLKKAIEKLDVQVKGCDGTECQKCPKAKECCSKEKGCEKDCCSKDKK